MSADQLETIRGNYPATFKIIDAVCEVWPEHAKYLQKGFAARDASLLSTTESLAAAALILAGDNLGAVAQAYRWTCDQIREEELHFFREDGYRLSTFEEANREVYSNDIYMEKYMHGLLLSQVLWHNHASSFHFFLREIPKLLPDEARYLEIGPGHGLMMFFALRDFGLASATAWDLSEVSVDQTRNALALLGYHDAEFGVQNIMDLTPASERYQLVVLSEILEHLEDPKLAMRMVRNACEPDGGLVFVNVPINSPAPDHLYLMRDFDDARALLTDTGFEIVQEGFFSTQGVPLERALKTQVSISACMVGRPV